MKKLTIMKAFVLSLMVAMCTVMPLQAQIDGFFRGGNDSDYENRASQTGSITNYGIGQTDPAPLGSGLLIMVAAGAGYAMARRKRNHKGMTMLLALALLFGMTQCKKNVETVSETKGLHITLDVSNGSKVVVTPGFIDQDTGQEYAKVDFENGDIIYVGHNRKYVGQLTYSDGSFTGTIDDNNLTTDDYFHFYFMGSKTPREQTASSITVDIINQTEKYPVISYARSSQFYHSDGEQIYTARLRNYCAIMKFTTPDIGANKAVKLKGMPNLVAVSFDQNYGDDDPVNPYTYGTVTDSEGAIIMHTVSGTERWAILLPNSPVTATATAAGYGATAAQPNLNEVTIPEIVENGYYRYHDNDDGYAINLAANGIIDGIVSVSAAKKVYCSSGNLQYQASTDKWRFAENQWDCVGAGNANISSTYDGWIDLFGWGTSGWPNNTAAGSDALATNYQPWSSDMTSYCDEYNQNDPDNYNPSHYGPTWSGTPNVEGHIDITGTNYDWGVYHTSGANGVPQITNCGGLSFQVSTMEEGYYFAGFTSESYGIRVKEFGTGNWQPLIGWGKVNGVNGFILLPDNWDGSFDPNFVYNASNWANVYSEATTPKWSAMEAYGVSFAPAAGYREGTNVYEVNSHVYFWCSEGQLFEDDFTGQVSGHNHYAYDNLRRANYMEIMGGPDYVSFLATSRFRYHGLTVRLWHYID